VTLTLLEEARASGATLDAACERLGLSARTVQRWKKPETAEDRRTGPRTTPANRISAAERRRILEVANSVEFRELSPKQIVPMLADREEYIASESTFYRVLRAEKQLAHRGKAKAPVARPKPDIEAIAPNQVYSWDITYLRTVVRGAFFYLYLVVDVYSRRIVGWDVHAEESSELAAALMKRIVADAGNPEGLKLHSDNGAPMKGNTLLATLQLLGVVPSFSRPHVSDDNPFSESLFRTLKYRPCFPDGPFASLEAARAWVADFVAWYNGEHRHSGINFVTPDERHFGRENRVLEQRRRVYERARQRHPERWSGNIRDWSPEGPVRLGKALRQREVRLAS
jgi:transposase InsO family protein